MSTRVPEVQKDGRAWTVVLTDSAGNPREFRYAHEAQARFFAAVFQLNPGRLPDRGTLPPKRKRKPRVAKVQAEAGPANTSGSLTDFEEALRARGGDRLRAQVLEARCAAAG
jgi:hypothetical protein